MPGITSFINWANIWFEYALSPIRKTLDLLCSPPKTLFSAWCSIALLGAIITSVAIYPFGITLKDVDFYMIYVITTLATQIASGLIFHGLLVTFKQKSELWETLKIYTIYFVYSPILTLFQLPGTYDGYLRIQWMKQSGLGIIDAMKQMQNAAFDDKFFHVAGYWLAIGSTIIDVICLIIMVEFLICWYNDKRYETYLAMAISHALAILPVIVISAPIMFANIYERLK